MPFTKKIFTCKLRKKAHFAISNWENRTYSNESILPLSWTCCLFFLETASCIRLYVRKMQIFIYTHTHTFYNEKLNWIYVHLLWDNKAAHCCHNFPHNERHHSQIIDSFFFFENLRPFFSSNRTKKKGSTCIIHK